MHVLALCLCECPFLVCTVLCVTVTPERAAAFTCSGMKNQPKNYVIQFVFIILCCCCVFRFNIIYTLCCVFAKALLLTHAELGNINLLRTI